MPILPPILAEFDIGRIIGAMVVLLSVGGWIFGQIEQQRRKGGGVVEGDSDLLEDVDEGEEQRQLEEAIRERLRELPPAQRHQAVEMLRRQGVPEHVLSEPPPPPPPPPAPPPAPKPKPQAPARVEAHRPIRTLSSLEVLTSDVSRSVSPSARRRGQQLTARRLGLNLSKPDQFLNVVVAAELLGPPVALRPPGRERII